MGKQKETTPYRKYIRGPGPHEIYLAKVNAVHSILYTLACPCAWGLPLHQQKCILGGIRPHPDAPVAALGSRLISLRAAIKSVSHTYLVPYFPAPGPRGKSYCR